MKALDQQDRISITFNKFIITRKTIIKKLNSYDCLFIWHGHGLQLFFKCPMNGPIDQEKSGGEKRNGERCISVQQLTAWNETERIKKSRKEAFYSIRSYRYSEKVEIFLDSWREWNSGTKPSLILSQVLKLNSDAVRFTFC